MSRQARENVDFKYGVALIKPKQRSLAIGCNLPRDSQFRWSYVASSPGESLKPCLLRRDRKIVSPQTEKLAENKLVHSLTIASSGH